jgi:peroxiredoxin
MFNLGTDWRNGMKIWKWLFITSLPVILIATVVSCITSPVVTEPVNPQITTKPAVQNSNVDNATVEDDSIDESDNNVFQIKVGDKAPAFSLRDLAGNVISLKDYYGKKVIINMWWLQCHGCTEEIPYLQEFYQKWADRVVFLAINSYDTKEVLEAYKTGQKLTFSILVDPNKRLNRSYIICGVPTTFFLDEEGIVRAIKDGGFESAAEIEIMLNSY